VTTTPHHHHQHKEITMTEFGTYGGTTAAQPAAATEADAWAALAGGTARKSLRLTYDDPSTGQRVNQPVGYVVEGTSTEPPRRVQRRNYDTNELEFWDDGNPIYDVVIPLQTNLRIDEEDDGIRDFYIKGKDKQQALQAAMQEAGVQKFGVGSHFHIQIVGYRPTKGQPVAQLKITLRPTEHLTPAQAQLATGMQQPPAPVHNGGQQWAAQAPTPPPAAAQPQLPTPPAPPITSQDLWQTQQATAPAAPAAPIAPIAPPAPPAPPANGFTAADIQRGIDSFPAFTAAGYDRATSIQMIAEAVQPGNAAYRAALDTEIPF
jgi:hypothetical protein